MDVNPDAWSYCVFQSQVGQLGANCHLSVTAPMHTMSLGAQQLSTLGFFWAPRSASLALSNLSGEYSDFFFQIQEGPVLIIGESVMTLQRSPVHSERAPCILCYDCGKEICGAPRCTCGSRENWRRNHLSLFTMGSGDQTLVGRFAEQVCPQRHLARPHTHSWILDRVQAALFLLCTWNQPNLSCKFRCGHWAGPVSYIVDPGLGLVACPFLYLCCSGLCRKQGQTDSARLHRKAYPCRVVGHTALRASTGGE